MISKGMCVSRELKATYAIKVNSYFQRPYDHFLFISKYSLCASNSKHLDVISVVNKVNSFLI